MEFFYFSRAKSIAEYCFFFFDIVNFICFLRY